MLQYNHTRWNLYLLFSNVWIGCIFKVVPFIFFTQQFYLIDFCSFNQVTYYELLLCIKISCSYIDVEPESVFGADVCEGVEGVEGAEDGGASGGDHDERALLIPDGLDDALLQMLGVHAAGRVSLHLDHIVGADAQPVRTLQTRVVALRKKIVFLSKINNIFYLIFKYPDEILFP